uniref:Uncharacterized protein n=1 Tax=Anguilla anguilla TaxID=7936 RepID=A0A0E9W4A6_ANGAN
MNKCHSNAACLPFLHFDFQGQDASSVLHIFKCALVPIMGVLGDDSPLLLKLCLFVIFSVASCEVRTE